MGHFVYYLVTINKMLHVTKDDMGRSSTCINENLTNEVLITFLAELQILIC